MVQIGWEIAWSIMSGKPYHFLLPGSLYFFLWAARGPWAPECPMLLGYKLLTAETSSALASWRLPQDVSHSPPPKHWFSCLKNVSYNICDSDRLPLAGPLLPLSSNLDVESWFSTRVGGSQEICDLTTLGMIPSWIVRDFSIFFLYLSECELQQWCRGCVCVCVHAHTCTCTLVICMVPGLSSQDAYLGPISQNKKKVKRGPTDRIMGHRKDKCLFFLMRKDKPDEQRKQFNSQSAIF